MTPDRVLRLVLILALTAVRPAMSAQHLDIQATVDPVALALEAQVSIRTQTTELIFYLADDFVVESIEVDGATVPADHASVDRLRRFQIELPDVETASTVIVRYHGSLKPLDTAMTHDDTLGGLPAMASEAGAYLPGNSGWHPILETPFTYRLESKVPGNYVAVASGAPGDEQELNGFRRASFSMDKPVDGIDLMVGKWVVDERIALIGETRVRLRTYFEASETSLSAAYLDAAQGFIERYARQIGPYPYTIFSVVSSPIPTGFGMPTLTYLGKAVLHYPFIRDISLGHEVLHNWWGNGIRVDPVRGNWAEGLTTFMADYAYREEQSAQAAKRMRHGWLRHYATLPPASERRLSEFRSRHHTASAAIGYGKAAMMFYDLRERLGADEFMAGLRLFWARHRYRSAGFDELRDAFETVSATSLADFFEQWLERTGAPEIRTLSAKLANDAGTELELELSQDAKSARAAPFSVSLPLRIFTVTDAFDLRVKLSQAQQRLDVSAPSTPVSVQIDPDFEVWRTLLPEEAPPILRDVIAAEQVLIAPLEPALKDSLPEFARAFTEGAVKSAGARTPASSPPIIVAGSKTGVARHLDTLGRAARPAQIAPGSIEVWIAPDPGRRILVISIDPALAAQADLSRLGRRLRHLAAYSWVSLSEEGPMQRGHWPNKTPSVTVSK
jgi:aminopeptidase N